MAHLQLFDILFVMAYGWTTLIALLACCYLLLRRSNIFATDVQSPLQLRRMAATYFSSLALAHVWWFLLYFNAPSDFRLLGVVICQMLDYTLVFLTTMGTLLSMLQDSRRPFWPTIVMALVILAFLLVAYIFSVDIHLASFIAGAAMILFIVITMLRYLVQYSRWLRDNYSDLEHKEV